ncbi:protein HOTHEAD [Silene latifolia]|uniref:protein HOTHEAD n=1 Tax=Silene latifolia TaxID=37657 RepID=UPI003D781EBA
MAFVSLTKFMKLYIIFLSCILLFFNFLAFAISTACSQGSSSSSDQFKYPFIKRASTFSSSGGLPEGGYDYIIVGGGTAGCPLAATLSQKYKVLVLERGDVPFGNYNVSYMQNFHISLADTSPTSASQQFISTDRVFNSRARVLGGGTCINAGFYSRASSSFVRRAGWDEKLVNESFPWIEKQIVYEPKLGEWQTTVRDALLDVGISPFNGFTYDHKFGTKVGGTIFEDNGRRHSAAELLASANPATLDVLVHATVQRITFNSEGRRKPKAKGVIFKDENGRRHEALLSQRRGSEIIVSSGAIGSTQLLLLSGIGPKKDLQKLNIPVVVDNHLVGKGMQDNPLNTIFVPFKKFQGQSLIQTVGITKKGVYIEASNGFGQSTSSILRHHGIASAEIGQLSTIPPRLRTHKAIQDYKDRKQDLPFEVFNGGFILGKIARPRSIGHLKLIDTNVDNNPAVTFNYFSHPHDLRKCVESIRIIEKLVKSKHFVDYTGTDEEITQKLLNMSVQANVNLIPKQTNDTQSLEQFCKDTVITIWHYHGGCQVGRVVNHDYRVLGVDRIRVIDGSTFTESPGTNPQATVMMMGRYMGVKILRERLGKGANV